MKMVKLRSSKGVVGEDLLTTILTIILLMGFIFSIFHFYGNYFDDMDLVERERVATSVAEKIYLDNEGVLFSDSVQGVADVAGDFENMWINITNLKTGKSYTAGNFKDQVSVGSVVMLLVDDGEYFPSRVDVYVSE